MSKTALCIGITTIREHRTTFRAASMTPTTGPRPCRPGLHRHQADRQPGHQGRHGFTMSALISGAAKGDTVVITYSGHGTWVPTRTVMNPTVVTKACAPGTSDRARCSSTTRLR